MTAIPLLSGVAGTETGEFIRTYPLNLEPVIIDSKISEGQLKVYPGAVQLGTGYGPDRGGIFWNGSLYRVSGNIFISVAPDGSSNWIADVGPGARCSFDYSFDRLGFCAGGSIHYYTPDMGCIQLTDPNLGTVIDMIWIDGYFMFTDGTYVLVTELADPTTVKPLKYGSAEEDPDPITGLIKYREEAYILGRHTTQVFTNVGGFGFPFADNKGAGLPFGCVGPMAKCLFGDGFAFVGSGRNDGLNVYLGAQGTAQAVGCRELCEALDALPDPSVVEVEERSDRSERRLFVHLPDSTWVFLLVATEQAGTPIWFKVATDASGYRCRNAVDAYGMHIVADAKTGTYGYLTQNDLRHFGIDPDWQFDVGFIYNDGLGAIVHSVELVGLPGRGGDGAVFMSMTRDGETWGAERSVKLLAAERQRRIAWRPHARIGNYMGLRFRGTGTSLPGIASCEAKLQALTS